MAFNQKYNKLYSKFILDHPWLAIIAALVIATLITIGGQRLLFSTDYRVFFGETNPQLEAFEAIERVYSKTDNILFTIKPKSGDVFTPECLSLIQELTEKSWKLPFSQRVDSLTNYQHTYAVGDDLTVTDLVDGDPNDLSETELSDIKRVALSEPLLVNRIVSKGGLATGVNITVNMPRIDMDEVQVATKAAREMLEEIRAKYPSFEIRASGVVFLNNAFVESSMQDLQTLIPLMYLVLIAMMILFLRNGWGTFATVIVIALSATSALGFGGWIGVELTPLSSTTPTIVLTLAIADSVHIIVTMLKEMQHGRSKYEALKESMRVNLQPVFLTSLTTIIGFLSLNFSDSPPFHDLGNMTAFGIGAAFVYSVLFLPAFLQLVPVKVRKINENNRFTMLKFSEFIIARRRSILYISLIFTVVVGSMISRIETNDLFVQYFDESISFRPDTEFMMKHLTGIYSMEFSVGAEGESGISDPIYLQNLEKFTTWLRQQPQVVHVYSMADIFKRLNKNMHGDDPSWYRIPDSRELGAQYLLLYEFSLPYGLDLNDRVNIGKSHTRVSVTLKDMSTKEIRAFKDKTESWLEANTPNYMQTEATSPVIMFAYISQRNIEGMMKGNIVSLLLISLSIMLALRSLRIGIFSLIPNLSPIAIGYGLWGIFVSQINMAVAVAAAVSLGIIVDDTVHFLSKYFRAKREKGLDVADSVRYAFSTVGMALLITTFILMAGFSMLTISGFQINVYLGLLTAVVIGSALLADFFLLPTLLLRLDRQKE